MDLKNHTDIKTALERIAESVTDGRAENVRYRQEELFNLHRVLVEQAPAICQALSRDGQGEQSQQEAETEYYLTLDAVRHFYGLLDFDQELEKEYRVANGKNNEERRVGFGMVVIRPTSHTRFYSIVVPRVEGLVANVKSVRVQNAEKRKKKITNLHPGIPIMRSTQSCVQP